MDTEKDDNIPPGVPSTPILRHDITPDEVKELSENLKQLTKWVRRFNSLWRAFFRGVLIGIGTAIGATIIATLLFAMAAKFTNSLSDIPFFGKFIPEEGVETYFEQ